VVIHDKPHGGGYKMNKRSEKLWNREKKRTDLAHLRNKSSMMKQNETYKGKPLVKNLASMQVGSEMVKLVVKIWTGIV
jgi:hypothetical protein